ncbi:transcription antiterminator LicT [Mediterraneibacter butyricigenes]|uniref:Transcription antiterminator LicT n=1 Tax=Mediterraneibacter butyricigenes TaxID=2316025 RepID=A0A391PBK6_9FIRM|nr:transcription antiterminator LicT [Mediterraneibacter butyricigenes]
MAYYIINGIVIKACLKVRVTVKIVRVLNTNAVVSIDQEGRELIITGAGIGFKKKKGENLDEALADKTYYLESVDDSRRLQEVVKEISEEYLEIASRVVKTAREEGLKVRDSLYMTLTDHINSAVDRYRENIALKNMMKLEIRKFYPQEYEIGLKAVKWIQEQNDENLGVDEAAFIAMHIISAELGNGSDVDFNKITELINAVLQIVRIYFKIEFDEKSISYERFLTHLKFFAARVFDNTIYQDSMQEIYKVLIEQNEYVYSGVRKIVEYIEKQYSCKLTIDERLYLLIHIKRILDEQSE